MKAIFLRALEAEDKASGLLEAVHGPDHPHGSRRFEVDPSSFVTVPGSPFAYWVSGPLRQLFVELPPFEGTGRSAKVGLQTSDDFRFVRCGWEMPTRLAVGRWFCFAKGGEFSPFYADIHLMVKCIDNFAENVVYTNGRYPYLNGNARSLLHADAARYFRPGLTWPIKNRFSFKPRVLSAGCIFAHVGSSLFVEGDDPQRLSATQALMSASVFTALVRVMAGWNFEVGVIQRTPFPEFTEAFRIAGGQLARQAWLLARSLDTRTEISHAFTIPTLLQVTGTDADARAMAWSAHIRAIGAELARIQAEIDERSFELYGVDEADRRAITEGFGTQGALVASSGDADEADDDLYEAAEVNGAVTGSAALAAELVSWAVGVAFGRFDLRLATGARSMPPEPEPFDPLPVCSPGMLTGGDGLPLAQPPAGYPLTFPETGVLVDDPGQPKDLTAGVRAVFDVVFGTDADRWWRDVAAMLDPKGHDLRSWLAGSFFEHHLKRYSKSRRKAPIFWQLSTAAGRYSVWLYAHRLTGDSLFQLQNDVVGPKLIHEERQLTSLRQNAGTSPSASERKEIAAQEAFVQELHAMLDEVKLVAPLWNPNLDDGVVLTMAPLWRLVPQHKPWQRELRSKWEELAAGKYDWAHVAMHLWPERVVPKCATDRSLAIAHGLEDVFWVEGVDGKWKPRPNPARPVDDLVDERSSSAVKAALLSILNAPNAANASVSVRSRSGR